MLVPWEGCYPTCASSSTCCRDNKGCRLCRDSPGSHQANVEKMLWIWTQPSAFCHGNSRLCQNELWPTGPAPADSVMESDDDSSFLNRKLRGKVSYSSKSSALPWKCMDDAYHQFWEGRNYISPVFTLSRCAWAAMSPERTWELSPQPTHAHMHEEYRRNTFTHLMHVLSVEIS